MSNESVPDLEVAGNIEYLHCSTKMKIRTFGIRWTIENYDVVCKTEKLLQSPEFPEGEEESRKWWIEFEPLEITPDDERLQEIKLINSLDDDVYVATSFCLENESKGIVFSLENESKGIVSRHWNGLLLPKDEYVVYTTVLKDIYQKLYWNQSLQKNLIINCKVRIFESTQPKVDHVCRKMSSKYFESSDLTRDISKLLINDEAFQDVTISVRNKTFRAHKAILATRSEVFEAMFRNEMSEKKNSSVEIKDLTSDVVEKMLRFIYTDKVENSELKEFAPELLAAAEKYNLKRLKEITIAAMRENLAVGNVLKTLEASDIYSVSDLKKEALKFLFSHQQVVKSQDEFKVLIAERPHLIVELMDIIHDTISENPSHE